MNFKLLIGIQLKIIVIHILVQNLASIHGNDTFDDLNYVYQEMIDEMGAQYLY